MAGSPAISQPSGQMFAGDRDALTVGNGSSSLELLVVPLNFVYCTPVTFHSPTLNNLVHRREPSKHGAQAKRPTWSLWNKGTPIHTWSSVQFT